MKRFLVFLGDYHYPSGGWEDFRGDFDTIFDAQTFILNEVKCDWYQIVDTGSKTIIHSA